MADFQVSLDRLERKVDQVLDRTKNVESDHQEILNLRKRMHDVEGATSIFKTVLDTFDHFRVELEDLDLRVGKVEGNQMTADAVKKALEEHSEKVGKERDRKERRIFAVLALLASLGVLNFIINLLQAPPPTP